MDSHVTGRRPRVEHGVLQRDRRLRVARQREGGKSSDAEALVLPREEVVLQVDLLVHHLELVTRRKQLRCIVKVLRGYSNINNRRIL